MADEYPILKDKHMSGIRKSSEQWCQFFTVCPVAESENLCVHAGIEIASLDHL
jgi:hypothetical protein